MIVGALFVSVPTIFALQEKDVLDFYQTNVHARATGVYELEGWYFFHHRAPVQAGDLTSLKNLRLATSAVAKEVLDKIDELAATSSLPIPRPVRVLKSQLKRIGSSGTTVKRSFSGLKTRCLSQDEFNGDFVYDLAVSKADMLAEAAKGCFENRLDLIVGDWRKAVCQGLKGPAAIDFVKRSGVFDVYPVNAVELNAQGGLGEEYMRLEKEIRSKIQGEIPVKLQYEDYQALRDLILEEDAKALSVQFEHSSDLMLFEKCLQETDRVIRYKYLFDFLSHTPGSRLYWLELGNVCVQDGKYHLAIICYRNALRLNRVRKIEHPLLGLAKCYRELGYEGLSDAAAAFAVAVTTDTEVQKEALDLLDQ